ncbi:DUF6207 family protein [Streptomyces mirabilis]|uniref:DUF6207 family protein n=1 Tax=Streptomyces mirabilis TaxID=68239 RepID=UPI0036AA0249
MGQADVRRRLGDTPGWHTCGNPGVADLEPRTRAVVGQPDGLRASYRAHAEALVSALSFHSADAQTWPTAIADRATRVLGQPGVRLRLYPDLQQALPRAFTVSAESPSTQ